MTTAARPTFLPAMGGFSLRDNNTLASRVRNNLDLKSEFTLKFRQKGQNSLEEVKDKDFEKELNSKESILGKRFLEIEGEDVVEKRRHFLKEISDLDQDDSSSGTESEEEEEEDETEALMRELQAIKQERKLQELKKEEEEASKREEEALLGNPLLNFQIKKRWDDDVIFKNQAVQEEKPKKRFINDLLRSDFHRKFMSKYIK